MGASFENLLATRLGTDWVGLDLQYSVLIWINDGLMAIFFLMVGLEIKRELVEGELSSVKKAALPIFAAIGGVAVPALFYMMLNRRTETAVGWGIPMATDIAFALALIPVASVLSCRFLLHPFVCRTAGFFVEIRDYTTATSFRSPICCRHMA